jgi:hypothetical protein
MRIKISLSAAQATPVALHNKVCPKCASTRISTERRVNGNSMCACGHTAPTKEFMQSVAQVDLQKTEPLGASSDGKKAPYGYCPICNDIGSVREKRPNGNDRCIQGHTYPSASSLPSPLGGYCEECHMPSPEPESNNGEYENRHTHPKFCIPK